MKIKGCGLKRSYGRPFGGRWMKWKPRMKGEDTSGVMSYMDHVAGHASMEAFTRSDTDGQLSIETLLENNSFLTFSAFAQDHQKRFFDLLKNLRPEFQEICIEYYVLHKSQNFIGKTHGFIQTRTWQALRIIEQTMGAMILLGPNPSAEVLLPILQQANVCGGLTDSLADMIETYAATRSYSAVAAKFGIPVPAVRKIFRPAIKKLLANKDMKATAVGAYLRSLTHNASLTGTGLSKRCIARTRRMKALKFHAPPADDPALLNFGNIALLKDTPWNMLEISSDHRMVQLAPVLRAQGKRLFGKKPGQIFAPVTDDGELKFGYIFVRSSVPKLVRSFTRIRGIAEMAAIRNEEGEFVRVVTVPDLDVQTMIGDHQPAAAVKIQTHEFVEILTGEAAHYFGTVSKQNKKTITVEVNFPTGRHFTVVADKTGVRPIPKGLAVSCAFWGARVTSE